MQIPLRPIYLFAGSIFSIFLLAACGSESEGASTGEYADPDAPQIETGRTNSACDASIEAYEKLIEDAIAYTDELIDGAEPDPAREKRLREEADRLNKSIQEKGIEGLGDNCWKKFQNMQLRYAEAGQRLARKAYERALQEAN